MPYPQQTLEKRMHEAAQKYQSGSDQVIEEVYHDLMPFCLRVASRTCNRYIDEGDEEASIANFSILEAFEKYSPERGAFLSYLGRVVRNRIIDYKRREKKKTIIPISNLIKLENIDTLVDDTFFDSILEDMDRQKEIEDLRALLDGYNISFADLVKTSPGHAGSREKVRHVIEIISSDSEFSRQVLENKTLPAKVLKEQHNISTKLLDRYRKFIIAGVIIIAHDFSYLVPYVLPSGGKKDG
ncbi:MAG TPA: hypothetical protein DD811_11960 [Syntrophomonas sp.]|jgi:RNA polymerase sigma factor|nr:hypothetical protein [Syntrophomonas sp.]